MVTWSQAVDGCKSFNNNARLVAITSSQEQSAVVSWWENLPGNNTANSTKCMHFIAKYFAYLRRRDAVMYSSLHCARF